MNTRRGGRDLGVELVAALGLRPGQRVLDVGCGSGAHLGRFCAAVGATGRALGVDFSPAAAVQCRQQGLEVSVANATALPFNRSAFDALACIFAVYYIPDWRRALLEWARALTADGRMVVAGPAADSNPELYAFHHAACAAGPSDADRMALGFVAAQVVPRLPDAGFEVERVDTFENVIAFTDDDEFLDYWCATSLFARTPGATRAAGAAVLAVPHGHVRITKRVTIAVAHRVAPASG